VSKSAVSLARGGRSRLKMIDIAGLEEAEVRARIDRPARS
jgi:uncharacterized protein YggU (UPF0235/DUF167 family)